MLFLRKKHNDKICTYSITYKELLLALKKLHMQCKLKSTM